MSLRTMKLLTDCIPTFTMLQDENRQQIIVLLFEHPQLTVTGLTERLSISRPAVSHHLKLLHDAGLVTIEKRGKERLYSLCIDSAAARLRALLDAIEDDLSARTTP